MNGIGSAGRRDDAVDSNEVGDSDELRVSDPQVLDIMRMICNDAEPAPPAFGVLKGRLIELVRQQLLESQSSAAQGIACSSRGLAQWQVKRVSAYMQEHLEKDIGLQELADLVKLSRFYFCTAFRVATGCTPRERLTQLRIDEARRLLALPSMTITDIALAVGYQTPSAFAATFRRVVGVSPSEYRRSL